MITTIAAEPFLGASAADSTGIAAIQARVATQFPQGAPFAVASAGYSVGLHAVATSRRILWCGDLVVAMAAGVRAVTGADGSDLPGATITDGLAAALAAGGYSTQWVVATGGSFPEASVAALVRGADRVVGPIVLVWVDQAGRAEWSTPVGGLEAVGVRIVRSRSDEVAAIGSSLAWASDRPGVSLVVIRSDGSLTPAPPVVGDSLVGPDRDW